MVSRRNANATFRKPALMTVTPRSLACMLIGWPRERCTAVTLSCSALSDHGGPYSHMTDWSLVVRGSHTGHRGVAELVWVHGAQARQLRPMVSLAEWPLYCGFVMWTAN